MVEHRLIAVSGNIGVGKSELTKILGERLNAETFLESEGENDNPLLGDFYRDKKRYALISQFWFLRSKYEKLKSIEGKLKDSNVILDRTIEEDVMIFAELLRLNGDMSDEDYAKYVDFYNVLTKKGLVSPDLTIYLEASVDLLMDGINFRGRDYELNMDENYLFQLNYLYESFFTNYKGELITIKRAEFDFVNREEDKKTVVDLVRKKLDKL